MRKSKSVILSGYQKADLPSKCLASLFLSLFILTGIAHCQDVWKNYTNHNYVTSLAIEGNYIWEGTNGGVVKRSTTDPLVDVEDFTKARGLADNYVHCIAIDGYGNKWFGTYGGGVSRFDGVNWATYNTSNSGLADNYVLSTAIDGSGNKWFGTQYEGVCRFDGVNWTTYDTSNSGLADNTVFSIAIDGSGNMWFGTNGGGVSRFDGVNWTTYNIYNSGLAENDVVSIAVDGSGNMLFGTFGRGVSKFDGVNWTTYNTSNSGLADNYVYSIAIDGSGNKWLGTYGGGVSRFDEVNWTTYNTSNSGLASDYVLSIAIDGSGNKWFGTYGGGVGYLGSPTSVPEEHNQNNIPYSFELSQNYPNPFNPATTIEYQVASSQWSAGRSVHTTLKIYNILGQLVKTLVDEEKLPGNYAIIWDGKDDAGKKVASGIYFYQLKTKDYTNTKKMVLLR